MKRVLLLLSLLSILLCSCSYSSVENTIRSEIEKDDTQNLYTDTVEPVLEEDIRYFQIEEDIPGYKTYIDSTGEEQILFGSKGVYYHIDNVEVLNSFEEANIPHDEIKLNAWEWVGEECNNAIILLDMTLKYDDTLYDPPQILGMDFGVDYGFGDGFLDFDYSPPNDMTPQIVYFSDHVEDGDVNPISGYKMNSNDDYYIFKSSLSNEYPIKFRIAIVSSKVLIEEKMCF